jgi:hypothetical protein
MKLILIILLLLMLTSCTVTVVDCRHTLGGSCEENK